MGTPPTSQEQGNSEDSICWFPQLPPDLLVRMLSQMGLEDHHMSRAACKRFCRAYGGEDGVWMRLYLLHFISEGVTLPESFTWQQAEQRYNQHLRERVLNALSKITPGSVRAGSSFMCAGQEFKKYEDLDLSNCTCDSLPLEVWSIQTLVRLNLSRCRLRELSPAIGELKSLEKLELYNCIKLERLPEGIGECTALRKLNLEWCKALETLPNSIGNCTALQTLNCIRCYKLQSLPPTIGELTNLKKLAMYKCPAKNHMPAVLKEKLHTQGCEITDF